MFNIKVNQPHFLDTLSPLPAARSVTSARAAGLGYRSPSDRNIQRRKRRLSPCQRDPGRCLSPVSATNELSTGTRWILVLPSFRARTLPTSVSRPCPAGATLSCGRRSSAFHRGAGSAASSFPDPESLHAWRRVSEPQPRTYRTPGGALRRTPDLTRIGLFDRCEPARAGR